MLFCNMTRQPRKETAKKGKTSGLGGFLAKVGEVTSPTRQVGSLLPAYTGRIYRPDNIFGSICTHAKLPAKAFYAF